MSKPNRAPSKQKQDPVSTAEPSPQPETEAVNADAEIARLAKLSKLQYEQQRKGAIEKLALRASILDKLVEGERLRLNPNANKQGQGQPIEFPEPEPWPDVVKGAELLDAIATAIRNHIVMPDCARDICTLWVAHTYLVDCFLVTPRLAIRAPTRGCGKTTLLDVIEHLVLKPLRTSSVTASVTFRVIESYRPTLLIDEAKNIADKIDLLEVLNDGHRRGGRTLRNVAIGDGYQPRAFATFAALAIALIGFLPPELHDRSVVVDMKRRLPGDEVKEIRVGRNEHLDTLARKAMRWAADNASRIAEAEPVMPSGIYNRAADNWKPLLAIADIADGEWPERARAAASAAASHRATEGDEGPQLEALLGDIRTAFAEEGEAPVEDMFANKMDVGIASADLIQALVAMEGRPWAEMGKSRKPLTTNGLARRLKPLAIIPQNIRIGDKVPKGYRLDQFREAFTRYLPPEGASEPLQRYNADEMGTSDPFQTATNQPNVAVRKYEKPNNDGQCSVVAVEKRGRGDAARAGNGADANFPTQTGCAYCGRPGGNAVSFGDGLIRLHRECERLWIESGA